jgi:uncharacterized membrane protein YhaH (DUF805 family)
MTGRFAGRVERLPSWIVGLLVIAAYLSTWGVVFVVVGLSHHASDAAGRLLRDVRWVLLALSLAALASTVAVAARRARARDVAPTVATQITTGAMLTFVTVGSALAASHRSEIRNAYSVMPAGVAALDFAVVGVLCALVLVLLSRATRTGGPRGASLLSAALGLALVAALAAFAGAAALVGSVVASAAAVAGSAPVGRGGAWHALEWGGAVALALPLLFALVARGVWRMATPGRNASTAPGSSGRA